MNVCVCTQFFQCVRGIHTHLWKNVYIKKITIVAFTSNNNSVTHFCTRISLSVDIISTSRTSVHAFTKVVGNYFLVSCSWLGFAYVSFFYAKRERGREVSKKEAISHKVTDLTQWVSMFSLRWSWRYRYFAEVKPISVGLTYFFKVHELTGTRVQRERTHDK